MVFSALASKHCAVKMHFHTFLCSPGGFIPVLYPILFPLGSRAWHYLSTTTCYLSKCGTHTNTHTHLNVWGMWHLFSLRSAPRVLDLSHIASKREEGEIYDKGTKKKKKVGMKGGFFCVAMLGLRSVVARLAAWWTQSSQAWHQSSPPR